MASKINPQILSGAQNVTIHGGSFITVGGDMIVNRTKHPGKKRLLANITQGAFYDAAERGTPPKCHPRTRIAIRQEIMQWVKDPGPRRQFILWLYGPAGSGKTAIAQSIAEACAEEGRLAASFFFGRLANGRNTSTHFVATLAYQLSRSIPKIEDRLLEAIENEPTIFSRSLATQMQVLIIEPLTSVQLTSLPRLVVVDGIDECGLNQQAHAELLEALGHAIGNLRHVSIIFLIASRPEYQIRETFNGRHLSHLVNALVLDDSYEPDEDIKNYFDSTFREIYEKHLRLGTRLLLSWPAENDIDLLVKKASGQFIFAATVTKFINSPRHNPPDRLNIILHLSSTGSESETPFALLDALYRFILDSVADVSRVLEVLTLLLLSDDHIDMDAASELLGFDIRMALVDMHALIFVPPPTDNTLPRIYHASLYDFLMDRSRSLGHYINTNQGHANLSRRWLKIIGTDPRTRISETRIAVRSFNYHCRSSPVSEEIADGLIHFDLTAFLEEISDFRMDLYAPNWASFFKRVQQQGRDREDIYPRLQNDFYAFICNRIAQYPPTLQSYVPIILLGRHTKGDMLEDILFHGVTNSISESNELRNLDKRLLDVFAPSCWDKGLEYISHIFQVNTKEGNRFLDGGSFAALARVIVNVVCPKPQERNHRFSFENSSRGQDRHQKRIHLRAGAGSDANLSFFPHILLNASTDSDLAKFLQERAVQFRDDVAPIRGRRTIAQSSVRYIQRCGISYLKHTHHLEMNECAICTTCKDAVILGNLLPTYSNGSANSSPASIKTWKRERE